VLMAFFPFVLFGMMRRPNLTLAASVGIYAAARYLDWNLSAYPDGRWYFNPFCWQLLFVLGAWLALSGAKTMRAIHALQRLSILRATALLYLLFALIVTLAGKFPQLAALIPEPVLDTFLPNDKENIAPYRVLHFLALAFLVSYLMPRDWRGFQSPALQPLIKCGQEWLPVFCAGVFSVVCRTFHPDHGSGFNCDANFRQRRRNGRHDVRCLLRVVVQATGPKDRARA
jgi:hypothetical protein